MKIAIEDTKECLHLYLIYVVTFYETSNQEIVINVKVEPLFKIKKSAKFPILKVIRIAPNLS